MILQLTRKLESRPVQQHVHGISLRHYQSNADILLWLQLREAAFADVRPGVRNWSTEEFNREFLAKPWWQENSLWFAERDGVVVGSIGIARRRDDEPALHWLMVLPTARGQRIARALLTAAEQAIWDEGQRQIWLETHSRWHAAVKFYQQAGYEPAMSPRTR